MPKCKHINECKQWIDSDDLPLCLGEVEDFDQDECFKHNDLDLKGERDEHSLKYPKEWDKITLHREA